MSNIHTLYGGNDNILEVASLKNELTGEFLNDAVVIATLKDSVGGEVSGDSWPKTMDYLAASNGIYRVTLPHTLGLVIGSRYTVVITVDGSDGVHAEWSVECVCRARN